MRRVLALLVLALTADRVLARVVLALSTIFVCLLTLMMIGIPLPWWWVASPVLVAIAGGITLVVLYGPEALLEVLRDTRDLTLEVPLFPPDLHTYPELQRSIQDAGGMIDEPHTRINAARTAYDMGLISRRTLIWVVKTDTPDPTSPPDGMDLWA